jgi:hypothetical protein
VHIALRATSSARGSRPGCLPAATRLNRLLVAGVAATGIAAMVANPLAPNVAADAHHAIEAVAQTRDVRLAAGFDDLLGDYTTVFNQAGTNIAALSSGAQAAIPAAVQSITGAVSGAVNSVPSTLSPQTLAALGAALPALLQSLGGNLASVGNLFGVAASGTATGLQNALFGGWYGGDDGFVFGLFGGTVTHGTDTQSGSTLQNIANAIATGNTFNAFGYGEQWALEVLDHSLKPLLSPFLNTAKAGATPSETIPGDILKSFTAMAATLPVAFPAQVLQSITNLTNTFLSYPQLKAVADSFMGPALSVVFGVVSTVSKVQADFAAGRPDQALTDVVRAPADLVGDLLNGYVLQDPVNNPTGAPFTGLLNKGSLLENVFVNWPKQFVTALSPLTTPVTAAPEAPVAPAALAAPNAASPSATDSADAASTDAASTDAASTEPAVTAKRATAVTARSTVPADDTTAASASDTKVSPATTDTAKDADGATPAPQTSTSSSSATSSTGTGTGTGTGTRGTAHPSHQSAGSPSRAAAGPAHRAGASTHGSTSHDAGSGSGE